MTSRKIQTINNHGHRVEAMVTYEDVDIKDIKLGDKITCYNGNYTRILSVAKKNKKSVHGTLYVWTDTELKPSPIYHTSKVEGETFRRITEFKILYCDRCDNEGTFLYQDTTGEEEMLCRVCVDAREAVDISDGRPDTLDSKSALRMIKSTIDDWFYDQDEDKQSYVTYNWNTLSELILMTIEDAYEESKSKPEPKTYETELANYKKELREYLERESDKNE